MRLKVCPGEEAPAGYAGEMTDPRTGELRRSWAFAMTLSHSRHQHAVFVFDQKVEIWLRCHRKAFEYFGGVPAKIILGSVADHTTQSNVGMALKPPKIENIQR